MIIICICFYTAAAAPEKIESDYCCRHMHFDYFVATMTSWRNLCWPDYFVNLLFFAPLTRNPCVSMDFPKADIKVFYDLDQAKKNFSYVLTKKEGSFLAEFRQVNANLNALFICEQCIELLGEFPRALMLVFSIEALTLHILCNKKIVKRTFFIDQKEGFLKHLLKAFI